jgi:hypothetical protein
MIFLSAENRRGKKEECKLRKKQKSQINGFIV